MVGAPMGPLTPARTTRPPRPYPAKEPVTTRRPPSRPTPSARTGRRRALVGVLLAVTLSGLVAASAPAARPRQGSQSPAPAANPYPPVVSARLTGEETAQGINRQLDTLHQMGANAVTLDPVWDLVEPQKGLYSAARLHQVDYEVEAATARHMKVILNIWGSPCWASSAPKQGSLPKCKNLFWYRAWAPAQTADFGNFVRFMVNRYQGSLVAVEPWHEPDLANQAYLQGPGKPAHYVALLRAGYAATKSVNPNLTVLGGSLVGANGVFLKQLYAAGFKGSYDALSADYYDLTLADLRAIRPVMLAHGDSSPVWLQEIGWPSCAGAAPAPPPSGFSCVSPAQQGQNIADTLRGLTKVNYVHGVTIFESADNGAANPNDRFGLMRTDLSPKPSVGILQTLLASPPQGPRAPTVSGNRNAIQGTAPAGDNVILRAQRPGGGPTIQALIRPSGAGTFSWNPPRRVRSGRWRVTVTQPWSGRSASIVVG